MTCNSFTRWPRASRYLDWIVELLRPYLGGRVLEVGPGLGLMTSQLLKHAHTTVLEPDQAATKVLLDRFGAMPNFELINGMAENQEWLQEHRTSCCDTAVCINVPEHITEDTSALHNMYESLRPGGHLFLFVSTVMSIFGTLDITVGHKRRYSMDEVRWKVQSAKFDLQELKYGNLLGLAGWCWSSRVTRRSWPSTSILAFFDHFVPLWSWLESRIEPPIGMTLICIARKPQ